MTVDLSDAFAKLEVHLRHCGYDEGCSLCEYGSNDE